jgi:CheY-specific phosphatase CheX
MKMELIQPFINAADAVLSQGLKSPTEIGSLSMEEEAYRRRGVAAVVQLTGDIERNQTTWCGKPCVNWPTR